MTFSVPVQVSIAEASLGKAHITGGGLPGKYIAAQLHFHWGKDHSQGSEHTFRGRSYPLEVCDFSTLPIISFACFWQLSYPVITVHNQFGPYHLTKLIFSSVILASYCLRASAETI